MNAVALEKRSGIHGFTTKDVLDALENTLTEGLEIPDHVTCKDGSLVNMPSSKQLGGQDFTMVVTLDGERFRISVHDEMHAYCTNPEILDVFVVEPPGGGCPYATSRLDMRIVEKLRKNGIRVSKIV